MVQTTRSDVVVMALSAPVIGTSVSMAGSALRAIYGTKFSCVRSTAMLGIVQSRANARADQLCSLSVSDYWMAISAIVDRWQS